MIDVIFSGLIAKLAGATAVSSVVSTRIYATQAPAEAALPHLVLSLNAGGSTNRSPRDEFDVQVTIRATAADGATAAQLADGIRDALHEQDITLGGGWTAYDCAHQTPFAFTENEERRTYFHAGGVYRLRAVK